MRPRSLAAFRRLVLSMAGWTFAVTTGCLAQVVPSGRTATTVATAASGQITVGLAPVTGRGTSFNQYSAFSVPVAGVGLDNRSIGANTVVNAVAGTGRTLWNGSLEVLGSRAHVVVANPNGISIDGGSVVNVGGVALATGSVDAPGGNLVVGTGAGDIAIGPGGFSGSMTSLQLVAGRLRIDGPVVNVSASPNAEIALVAGNAEVALDGTVQANSTLRPWATRRGFSRQSSEVLVDVTPRGRLSASRVNVAVSARGAGVAFAGGGMASIGEFTISADGKVTVTGGHIQAERGVSVTAPAIEILNGPDAQGSLASLAGAVTLRATGGDIDLRGVVTGARRDGGDPASQGAVTLSATGDIRILSEASDRLAIAFASDGDLSVAAGGRVHNDTGRLLSNADVRIRAMDVVNTIDILGAEDGGAPRLALVRTKKMDGFGSKKIRVWRTDQGQPRIAGQLAYIVGRDIAIEADTVSNSGEIDAQDGTLSVNAKSIVNKSASTGTLLFAKSCWIVCRSRGISSVSVAGGVMNSAYGMQLTAARAIVNDGGTIAAYGNMALDAPSIVGAARYVPIVVAHPAGLRTFFAGPQSSINLVPAGGVFTAPLGALSVRTASAVILNGGDLQARTGIQNPAGVERHDLSADESRPGHRHVGILASWFE